MNLAFIENMDVASNEFFELYTKVFEKYWTFKDPNEVQEARYYAYLIAERSEPLEVLTLVNLFKELRKLTSGEFKATSGHLGFEKISVYFRFATQRDALDNLQKMLENTVRVKGQE